MPPELPQPPTVVPWYRQRWFRIVLIIVGVMALIAAIVAATLAIVWNSRPEKALVDTATYALKTPGSYRVQSGSTNVTVEVNGQLYAARGTINDVPFEAVVNGNSTLYIKSSDIAKIYNLFMANSAPNAYAEIASRIASTFNNEWIQIDLANSPVNLPAVSNVSCGVASKNIFSTDSNSQQQIVGAYIEHPFFLIESSKSSDQSSYQLSVDRQKFDAFTESFATNGLVNATASCTDSVDAIQQFLAADTTITVVVSEPTHQLKQLTLTTPEKTSTVTADYSAAPIISIPTDAITIDQITSSAVQSVLLPFLRSQ